LLKSSTDVAGKAITYPKDGKPEVSCLLVELPVGQNTGWHYHKNPSVEYILQGEITIEDETGAKRHFKSGDSFAELIGRKHCGKNTGALPVKILMVVVGLVGDPVSSK
jgi:quercetin dioxygenase-like cupin family protein